MPAIYRIIGQQQEILAYVPFLQFSDIKFTFELQIDFVLTNFGLNFHTSKLVSLKQLVKLLVKSSQKLPCSLFFLRLRLKSYRNSLTDCLPYIKKERYHRTPEVSSYNESIHKHYDHLGPGTILARGLALMVNFRSSFTKKTYCKPGTPNAFLGLGDNFFNYSFVYYLFNKFRATIMIVLYFTIY